MVRLSSSKKQQIASVRYLTAGSSDSLDSGRWGGGAIEARWKYLDVLERWWCDGYDGDDRGQRYETDNEVGAEWILVWSQQET